MGVGLGEGLELLPGERQGEEEGGGQFVTQGPAECQRQGQEQGEGQVQGLEQGEKQEEGEGSGQVFKREIMSEQDLGEEWQGHDQRESEGGKYKEQSSWGEEKQCQLMNASARAASSDLVSDLQDEGDHLVSDLHDEGDRLTVAHEANTRLSERSTELT